MAEVGVVVEVQLGVHAQDLMVGGLGERVDFDLSGVLLHEDLVELLNRLFGRLDALRAEAEVLCNLGGHLVRHAFVDVDFGGDDCLRVLLGDGLDVHAALAGGNNDRRLRAAIHEDGEVEFSAGELALHDVDRVANAALLAGLFRDQLVADHLVRQDACFSRRVDYPDTTLEAIVKVTLASASCQHLCLDHHVIAGNLGRDLLCFFC